MVPGSFVSEWACLPQVPDDRSPSAAVRPCLSLTDTGWSHSDRKREHRAPAECRPPNKNSGRDRCKCGHNWGSASFVAAQIIGKVQTTSSSNRLSAAPAEFSARRITAVATATEDFNRLGWTPVKGSSSDGNTAASAKLRTSRIALPAACASDTDRRRRVQFARDGLKRRVAAATAKLHALGETRMTFCTHHHN